MCNFPVFALRPKDGSKLVFGSIAKLQELERKRGDFYECIQVECGRCMACRMSRAKDWAVRCVMESKLHDKNSFVTLTYDNEHLPTGNTLVKRDLQLFMKRLRKKFGAGIRFFACGEYGTKYQRPHYHLLLFGFDFPDKTPWKSSKGAKFGHNFDNVVYRSASLEGLWTFGFSTVGSVSYESCSYVSRYILKKQRGEKDENSVYRKQNILPEFTLMSRKPGIARSFYDLYGADLYEKDFVQISEKVRACLPRYFDNLFAAEHGIDTLESIKSNRVAKLELAQEKRPSEFTLQRRQVKEEVLKLNVKNKLIRAYENGD